MISQEMMNFYHNCEDGVMEALAEKIPGVSLELKEFQKPNIVLTGIIAKSSEGNVAPTIYIDDVFAQYNDDGNLQDAIEKITGRVINGFERTPEFEVSKLAETYDIIPCVMNYKTNKEFLSRIPHIRKHDLAIYFRGVVNMNADESATFVITNDLARVRGLDANGLNEIAEEYVENNVEYMARGIMEMLFDAPEDENEIMYVITNDRKLYGAVAMFNEPLLQQVMDEKFHTDKLLIIPSSIHECIVIDGNNASAAEIQEMVTEVNSTQVAPEEVLSASVYSYKKEEGLQVAVQKDLTEKEISNDKEMKSPVMDM